MRAYRADRGRGIGTIQHAPAAQTVFRQTVLALALGRREDHDRAPRGARAGVADRAEQELLGPAQAASSDDDEAGPGGGRHQRDRRVLDTRLGGHGQVGVGGTDALRGGPDELGPAALRVRRRGELPGPGPGDPREGVEDVQADAAPFRLLGPAPAPLNRLKGEHRVQFFLKGTNRAGMRRALQAALAARPEIARRTIVDVDPVSVL